MDLDTYVKLHTKIKFKWTMDLNVKNKTMGLLDQTSINYDP